MYYLCAASKFWAASRDHTISVWDADSGNKVDVLTSHREAVNCLQSIEVLGEIWSSSDDNTVRIWNVKERKCKKILCLDQAVKKISYSKTARLVWMAMGTCVVTYDPFLTKKIGGIIDIFGKDKETKESKELNKDKDTVETGLSRSKEGKGEQKNEITSMIVVEKSKRDIKELELWIGTLEGEIVIVEGRTGNIKERIENAHHRSVSALCLDGSRVWSGGWDGKVKVWDRRTKSLVAVLEDETGKKELVSSIVRVKEEGNEENDQRKDGEEDKVKMWCGSWDKGIKVWDRDAVEQRKERRNILSMQRMRSVTSTGVMGHRRINSNSGVSSGDESPGSNVS